MTVQPDHVYVIPPKYDMTISHGRLHLVQLPQPRSSSTTVDIFLRSLAADQGRDAIGIILSGMASDGTLGVAAVKGGGGITFAQDASAKFASMPNSAIAGGWVDLVLSPQGMAAELAYIGLASQGGILHEQGDPRGATQSTDRSARKDANVSATEPTDAGGGPSSETSAVAMGTPAVVIAVVKSPRKLLMLPAQRLLVETNQARLRFVELELMVAFTLCGVADTDAQMGDSGNVLRLVGEVRKAIESAQHHMAQAGGCPHAFK